MKTPNLITDSIKAKKALTTVQLTGWLKEFSEFSNAKVVLDPTTKENELDALVKRNQTVTNVLKNLIEGHKSATVLKLKTSDIKQGYENALKNSIGTSIATVMVAQKNADPKLAQATLTSIFSVHTKAHNGIQDFPIPTQLNVLKAKIDLENGVKPNNIVKDLETVFKSRQQDKPLGLALSHYSLISGNQKLAAKTIDSLPVDVNNFNEMVIRKRLFPNRDFGGLGQPNSPDFPFPDFGNPGSPDFGNGEITLPGLPDGFPDLENPIGPPNGRPFDENPINPADVLDRKRDLNITMPFTDGISGKFPENFYTYHYKLLDAKKIQDITNEMSRTDERNIINVIVSAHKTWGAALDLLKQRRFSGAITALNQAQDNALAILRCATTTDVSTEPVAIFERYNPQQNPPQPGSFNNSSPTNLINFDLEEILQKYTKRITVYDVFNKRKRERNFIGNLDVLHAVDWINPIRLYKPKENPLKQNVVNVSRDLSEAWTTPSDTTDYVGGKEKFFQRVSFFDFQLFCLAYLFIPFAKIEAYRFSKQYENALSEIDTLKYFDANFSILNPTIEKPFLKILEAQILLEKADKEYKSGTVSTNLVDSSINPKGLIAKSTYDKAIAAFDEYPLYHQHVSTAQNAFPAMQITSNPLLDKKLNQVNAKKIYLPNVNPTVNQRLGINPKKDFPWQNNLIISLDNSDGDCTNPVIYALIIQAKSRLLQISNGFNYIGYDDNFLPPWKFNFLLDRARYYTDQAKNLQRDYLNFISNAEREEFQEMSSGQALSMERMNLTIENSRVDLSIKEQETAEESRSLAELQETNAKTRKLNFEEYDSEADQADILNGISAAIGGSIGIITGGLALATGNPMGFISVAGGIGSIAGTAGAIKKEGAQRNMEKKNLDLTIKESEKAKAVSDEQLRVAKQSVLIANMQAQAALMRLEFAKDSYEYLRNRLTNAELWFRLAHNIREISNTYFRRAIEMSFLAEQAYEFMVDEKVDVIRFDYDNNELGDMLGADYLKADLDYLENHLIVNQKEKLQQVKCVISMARDFPQALQELRENGQSILPISLQYLEKRFPGLYQIKVAAIDLQPIAILNPTRFNVELTYLGSGLIRTQTSPAHTDGTGESVINNFDNYGANGSAPWIPDANTLFPVKTLLNPSETSIYSGLTTNEEASFFQSFSNQQKAAFEDCPAAAGWLVDMGMNENEFMPNSLADMVLTFYVTGYYSKQLKSEIDRAVENEESLVTSLFSASQDFPDELFSFQRSGSVTFDINPQLLTLNKSIGKLNELSMRLIPAQIESTFTRYSSISVQRFAYINNRLEIRNNVPQIYLEADTMTLNVTLTNVRDKKIALFTKENPLIIFKRNSVTSDNHVFPTIEFKKQGKQIVIIRDTTGGKLHDYSIEVFVSKNGKMILPTTTFTELKLESSKILKVSPAQLKKDGNQFNPVKFDGENAQFVLLDGKGKVLEVLRDLSNFKFNLSGHEDEIFTIITLYTKKIKGSINFNQDRNAFSENMDNNVLRTNTTQFFENGVAATGLSKHLFGTNLKTKVKSPLDSWKLSLNPTENKFANCYDCNGELKVDFSFIQDVILTQEYALKSL